MAGGRGNGSLKRRGSADVNPTAGAVVLAYLTEQVETVRSLEKAVGSLDPPSIREATVATQRLASVLASYRHLLQPEQVDSLRDDLEWLARVIIELEDIHALRGRLHVQAGEALGLAVLPAAVEHALDDREREAVRELHGALDTVRYAQLSERLDRLVMSPAPCGTQRAARAPRACRRRSPRTGCRTCVGRPSTPSTPRRSLCRSAARAR